MQTADVNHEDFLSKNQNKMDEQLLVKFYISPKLNQAATNEAGRPIYKDVEYIDIKIPGDRSGGACRPATMKDIQRFAPHYRAFKERLAGQQEETEGTLLSEWPLMTRSKVEEMSFYNVKTVEQLASMSDTHLSQFMGGNALKRQAVDWLKVAADGADMAKMTKELDKRDEQIEELQAQMKELMATKPKRKRSPNKKKAAPPPDIEGSDDDGNTSVDS